MSPTVRIRGAARHNSRLELISPTPKRLITAAGPDSGAACDSHGLAPDQAIWRVGGGRVVVVWRRSSVRGPRQVMFMTDPRPVMLGKIRRQHCTQAVTAGIQVGWTCRMELIPAPRTAITGGHLAHLVTLEPDGTPQVTLAWVGLENDEIVAGHLGVWRKVANMRRNPRVVLSMETGGVAANGLAEYLVVHGQARVTEGGAHPNSFNVSLVSTSART